MLKLKLTSNIDEFINAMEEMKERSQDMSKPLQEWGDYLYEETINQFKRQVDPENRMWAALKPEYLVNKMKKFPQAPILTASGKMKRTIYRVVGAKTLEIGLRSPVAKFHQEGTKNMPRREILGLSEKRINVGMKIFYRWMLEGR